MNGVNIWKAGLDVKTSGKFLKKFNISIKR